MTDAPRSVYIAYVHKDEWAHNFGKSYANLIAANPGGWGGDTGDARANTGGLPEGRNAAMQTLLDHSDMEWLCFIDTDMGFKPDALASLMTVAHPDRNPVVGALCFGQRELEHDGRNGYRWKPRPTIFDWRTGDDGTDNFFYRSHYPVNTLVECDATGAAFLVIHRSVGERIRAEFGGDVWFDRLVTDHGRMSEDLSFFWRWRQIAGPGCCTVHTGVRITHQKPTWIAETDFWSTLETVPATEPVDVVVPVLHRPGNVRPLLQSLHASTGLASAWFVTEPGDDIEAAEVRKYGGHVLEHPGTFAAKVNAAYRHLADNGSRWMFICGDDVMFHPAWLDHAQQVAAMYDATVVGTNDLGNPRVMAGDHATHLLIDKEYIAKHGASWDGPGVVCHEGYGHWFVDDEIVLAARDRGVWQMALGSYVEHMHPLWEKGVDDDVYAKGAESAEQDRDRFVERRKAHANIPSTGVSVDDLYRRAVSTPSDINEHLTWLHDLVVEQEATTVVELGVRSGQSTVALLAAVEVTGGQLWSVDIDTPTVPPQVVTHPRWRFVHGSDLDDAVLAEVPAAVDVLFIDTSHTYDQTRHELAAYGTDATVVVLHDTELERPAASPPTDPPYPVKTAAVEWATQQGRTFTNMAHNNGLGVIR